MEILLSYPVENEVSALTLGQCYAKLQEAQTRDPEGKATIREHFYLRDRLHLILPAKSVEIFTEQFLDTSQYDLLAKNCWLLQRRGAQGSFFVLKELVRLLAFFFRADMSEFVLL